MPEMPEIQGLTGFLDEHIVGKSVARVRLASISALKTYDPPITELEGAMISSVARHGKFIRIQCGEELHLIFHLAKAGWLRWYDSLPDTPIKLGRSPIALRLGLD